jgi:peptidoglycan/xylan/chitin deacetylase (PgdA/CDA1 family)
MALAECRAATVRVADPSRSRGRAASPLILAYHGIGADVQSRLFVTQDVLGEHVEFLRARGYRGYTFAAAERRRRNGTLPERAVVFTFDDAVESVAEAVPILAAVGWPATVFVVSNFAGTDRCLRWEGLERPLTGLSWAELAAIREQGWEIGSHTCNHRLLTALSERDIRHELRESRSRIIEELGSCETLAYPYGRADDRVASHAKDVGFLAACTCTGAILRDTAYLRPRLGLWNSHSGLRLKVRMSAPVSRLRRSVVIRAVHSVRPRAKWLPAADARRA